MFLISVHQTYSNNKLTKQRLIDKRIKTNKDQKINHCNKSCVYIENNISCNNLSNHHHKLTETVANSRRLMKISIKSTYHMQQVEEESLSMQRMRKYFANNGHKFLFNNT